MLLSDDNKDNTLEEKLEGDCFKAHVPTLILVMSTTIAIQTLLLFESALVFANWE